MIYGAIASAGARTKDSFCEGNIRALYLAIALAAAIPVILH